MKTLNQPLLNCLLMIGLIGCSTTFVYAQDQPAQKVSGSGNVISGKISTSDNQPTANARVTVFRAGSNTPGQNVHVDNEGNFETRSLEPGLYSVSVYIPGLIRDTSGPATPAYSHPGDRLDFRMIKGGVITGSVKNSNGDGLVAITVRAIRVRNPNGDPVPLQVQFRDTLTDDRGIYRLYGLPAGTYIVSAGGQSRNFGIGPMSAYEAFAPTYAPSATRDTAMEIQVTNGNESAADIQFREERGHVISGTITGTATPEGQQQFAAGVVVFDYRNRAEQASSIAVSTNNFSFALYGVIDGDYEIYATQNSSPTDQLSSALLRIKVQGADVTGLRLALAPLASIEGRVTFENDPKAACGKHRASTLAETVINSRRYERSRSKETAPSDVPFPMRNMARGGFVDSRGVFNIRGLYPGTYQIEPAAPASGWYVRTVGLDRNATANIPRDGVSLKSGDHVTGLTVTFAEGAAKLTGRLSAGEGQSLPLKLRVYLVPEDRLLASNVYRFYESVAERDGTFSIDNLAPGRYLIVARPTEETESGAPRFVRLDETLRTTVLKEADALKKAVAFKPCEQVGDFNLLYQPEPR